MEEPGQCGRRHTVESNEDAEITGEDTERMKEKHSHPDN